MAKQKKKRNKKYTQTGAQNAKPTTIRIKAVKRNKFQQWWFTYKKILKPILIFFLIFIAIVAVIIGFIFSIINK